MCANHDITPSRHRLPQHSGVILFLKHTRLVVNGDPVVADLLLQVGRIARAVQRHQAPAVRQPMRLGLDERVVHADEEAVLALFAHTARVLDALVYELDIDAVYEAA